MRGVCQTYSQLVQAYYHAISRFIVIENRLDFKYYFIIFSDKQLLGFLNVSVNNTPILIYIQIFKSPSLLEVPQSFNTRGSRSESEANILQEASLQN